METLALQAHSGAQATTAVNSAGMDLFDIPT